MREIVVVTGAGGFIGGHLTKRLVAEGLPVRAIDIKPLDRWFQRDNGAENIVADLRDRDNCDAAVRDAIVVYNLAADMGGMGFIEHNKALCMLSVLINTNLLISARHHGVRRFFFSSSACVYNAAKQARPDVVALAEEDAYPAMPEDGYGWEKLFSERMCRHFRDDFGLETRVARYHNIYGPWGTYAGGREKAPAAICRKIIEAQLEHRDSIAIWGDGGQTRSFTFISDCLEGTRRLMDSNVIEPLNIGSSEMVSIDELVDIVENIAGTRLRRAYQIDAPQGVRGRNSDNARIRERLGWEPSTTLRDGLEQTYRWIYRQMSAGVPHGSLLETAAQR
jgi:nucleoside-diphosphate-sugar epimerase